MTGLRVEEAITRVHHEEWVRVVAGLARRFGDLDVAEEAAAEAFVAAVKRWPRDGLPPNPGGWLATTATRKAIDRLRRESQRDAKHQVAQMLNDDTPPEPTGPVDGLPNIGRVRPADVGEHRVDGDRASPVRHDQRLGGVAAGG